MGSEWDWCSSGHLREASENRRAALLLPRLQPRDLRRLPRRRKQTRWSPIASNRPSAEGVDSAKERLASIRKLIDDCDGLYVQKHDTTRSALHSLEAEQKTRTDEMNRIIDDFTSQLYGEVENLIAEAKATIVKRISDIWSANPAETRRQQIDK